MNDHRRRAALISRVCARGQAAFANLTKMQVSLEDAAQLEQLGALAQVAPKLRDLSLSCVRCPADRNIPEPEALRSFARLRALATLRFCSFRLVTLSEKAFGSLGGLKVLILAFNQLQSLEPGAFQGLGELEELNLAGNHLRSLPPGAFQGLGGLKTLILAHNQLQSLEPGAFRGLGELEELVLDENHL